MEYSELRNIIREMHNDWLEKTYEHETDLQLSEYLAQEILKQFDVVKKGG
jgi:hypothetical protein